MTEFSTASGEIMDSNRAFLRKRRVAKGLMYLSFVTTLCRVSVHAFHVYRAFSCQVNSNALVMNCSANASKVSQGVYNRVQVSSFYLESFSALAFLVLLIAWPEYRFKVLIKRRLFRMPQLYSLAPLVAACMALTGVSNVDTALQGMYRTFWMIAYQLELAIYLPAAMAAIHVNGMVVRASLAALFPRESRRRKVMYWSWWSFLGTCAGHHLLFAGYDATVLSNVLHKTESFSYTNIDSLGVMVAITTRMWLAMIFFDKLFDWPLPDDVTERMLTVNINSEHLLYDEVADC